MLTAHLTLPLPNRGAIGPRPKRLFVRSSEVADGCKILWVRVPCEAGECVAAGDSLRSIEESCAELKIMKQARLNSFARHKCAEGVRIPGEQGCARRFSKFSQTPRRSSGRWGC